MYRKIKLALVISSVALLSACGGGGGSGASPVQEVPVVPVVPVVVAPVALFATTPQLLPDLKAKYDALCGTQVSVQNAIPANLTGHTDGKKDLLFNLWCGQTTIGTTTNGPVPNGVIALIQQSDGSFIDGTRTLFGVDTVNLGGVGIDSVVYDFNNDGYDDIVFAVNKEDGRSEPQNGTSNNVQKVFITSSSNGAYTVSYLGSLSHNYRISLVDNELGNKDIVTTPIGYGGTVEAWRYTTAWTQLSGYGWLASSSGNTFFKRKNTGEKSQIAVIPSPWPALGLDLYSRTSSTDWTSASSWTFSNVQLVPWLSWQKSTGTVKLLTIGGKDYIGATIEMGCELKRKPSEDPISLIMMSAQELQGGYHGGVIDESGGLLSSSVKLVGLSVTGGTLTNVNISITNEIEKVSPLKMECGDLNGDGSDDILVMPWGANAVPIVYLNDGSGNFSLVDTSKLPLPSTSFQDASMIYVDITGDGIRDLLYWPLTALSGNPSKVQYQIFKGLRAANATDKK
jgi:hypothetical protein